MDENPTERDYLKRLDPSFYRGAAFIHWTHTIKDRKTGWLDADLHTRLRETLIHCCFRYHLWCPSYCLMPDHIHLLLLGTGAESDQRKATRWFRRRLNWLLESSATKLQQQAYDHILRDKERDRFAFEKTAGYIRDNPVRADLVGSAEDWHFKGAVLPGFPEIVPEEDPDEFWEKFWKLYFQAVEEVKEHE